MKTNSIKSKSTELYTDLHPKTTIKGTGYINAKKAYDSLNLIKKRSLRYQFDVVNTLYNRAKFHPNRTDDMLDAMAIFVSWIKNYKKQKIIENKTYPFLSLNLIKSYEKLADIYRIGNDIRGIEKNSKTNQGFLKMLKSVSHPNKLQYIPIKINDPTDQDYWSYRINYIDTKLKQIKKNNTPLFYSSGKYYGYPTKQHLLLILHGFSPVPKLLDEFY